MENYSTFVFDEEKMKNLPLYIDSVMDETVEAHKEYHTLGVHYAFMCCIEGKLHVRGAHTDMLVTGGKGFFTLPQETYHYQTFDIPCRLCIVTYDGTGVRQIMTYFSITDSEIFNIDLSHFQAQCESMRYNIQMKQGFRAALTFQEFLYDLYNKGLGRGAGKNMEILNKYIRQNYCLNIDIQSLADIYGTSVSFLCREFKARYDVSPMVYVTRLRMEKARRMLTVTRKKVSDIALACGFSNTEYFCYVFKKHEHCTPLQYRREQSVFNAPME